MFALFIKRMLVVSLLVMAGATVAAAQSLEAIKTGTEAFKRNDYQQAIDSFSIALADPELADRYRTVSLTLRGIAFSNLEQFRKAILDYDSVIDMTPDSVLAYTRRGVAYVNLEDYTRALADFDRAIELKSDNVLARDNRKLVLDLLEDEENRLAVRDVPVETVLSEEQETPTVVVSNETSDQETPSENAETGTTLPSVVTEVEDEGVVDQNEDPDVQLANQAIEAPADAEDAGIPYVALSSVNVRAGPSNDDVVVNTLVSGQLIEKIGESGNWIQIRPQRGATGYVYTRFVGPREQAVEDEASPQPE